MNSLTVCLGYTVGETEFFLPHRKVQDIYISGLKMSRNYRFRAQKIQIFNIQEVREYVFYNKM